MEWFDSQDDIHRYSWFVTGYIPPKQYVSQNCALLTEDGGLSSLGKTYFA